MLSHTSLKAASDVKALALSIVLEVGKEKVLYVRHH